MEGVVIKPIPHYGDERGWLKECFRMDDNNGYTPRMCYVSSTNPGVVRGPHEHSFQTDFFIFVGPGDFELHLWDNREGSPTYKEHSCLVVGASNPVSVLVPNGVVHGYKNISDVHAFSINIPNMLYKGEGKEWPVDEVRHENLGDEFKIT